MTGTEAVNQLVAQRNGQSINIDGADAGQCTAVIHAFNLLIGYPLLMGNAIQYPETYQKNLYTWIPNAPTNFPLPGDIVVYLANNPAVGTGPFGHTGVIVSADVNKFQSFEQNDEPNLTAHVQNRPNYAGVWGWLHPVQLTQAAAPAAPLVTVATVVNASAGLLMRSGPGTSYTPVLGQNADGSPLFAKVIDWEGERLTVTVLPNGESFQVKAIVHGSPVNGNSDWAQSVHNRYVSCAYLALTQQGGAKGFLGKLRDIRKRV